MIRPNPSPSPSQTYGAALCALALTAAAGFAAPGGAILDPGEVLGRQTFWDNRDFGWYAENIPLFESPDAELDTTYYYRWDLMTKHLVYGSPADGYAFTEFIDRPFWSGTYGAISCPSGLQLADIRWFRDPRFARDYTAYWFRVPGAQPRRYSSWLADSAWGVHRVHPSREWIVDLLGDLIENYRGWEGERWDEARKMFWQIGHDDGMETNINSRQTQDGFRGAPGFRPTMNAYLYADALAIARVARLAGKAEVAEEFEGKAAHLKAMVQDQLWDPDRQFFFHMFRDDEEKDGHQVKAGTLTHESGQFAGADHGRELIGYVPWQFNLPDRGYESAWKFLMDPYYFYAPFGPTTVERNDPMFLIAKNCCVWSSNSWPYATAQTLKAMANLLQRYEQAHVDRADYYKLLRIFALTHRKDGKPYLAEALNPDTGSFAGHDAYNHSEHYFHSCFIDLVVTGLAGVEPGDGGALAIDPLAPPDWDYFALDALPYRGRTLSVIWDRDGRRYGRGSGLRVFADGEEIGSSAKLGRIEVSVPAAPEPTLAELKPQRFNYAANNSGAPYPRVRTSATADGSPRDKLNDGQYWYLLSPPNRWVAAADGDPAIAGIDFGITRTIDTVKVYVLDDGEGGAVRAPKAMRLEQWAGGEWQPVEGSAWDPPEPQGHRANTARFPGIATPRLRVVFERPAPDAAVGASEIEAWGPGSLPLPEPKPAEGNLALNKTGEGFPKASASHTSKWDTPAEANDGVVQYRAEPRNRWTSYESPNDSDWLAVDFGAEREFRAIHLHLYDDRGGVQTPQNYALEYWDGEAWREILNQRRDPAKPAGGTVNEIVFPAVKASRVRAVFQHAGNARSGVTEFAVWEKPPGE
ncbi:MAG: discoidin domain-containing protein [Verrucomicrobiales bacterium]